LSVSGHHNRRAAALFDPGDPGWGIGVDSHIERHEGAAETQTQSLDEDFLAGPTRQKCQRTPVKRKRAERRGLRRPCMGPQMWSSISRIQGFLLSMLLRAVGVDVELIRRKSRLAVLGLDEFDRPGRDAQALSKEPPEDRAGPRCSAVDARRSGISRRVPARRETVAARAQR
jgi:hypothetical protein